AGGRAEQGEAGALRGEMSMARLWGGQGRRGEAPDLLAPLHGWFTEGFETRDLKEAKVLLDELHARQLISKPPLRHLRRRVPFRHPPSTLYSENGLSPRRGRAQVLQDEGVIKCQHLTGLGSCIPACSNR